MRRRFFSQHKGEESGGIIEMPDYLTIEALEDGLTASLSVNACEYCVDGDGNWKSLSAGANTESINTGHILSFRAVLIADSTNGVGTFTISKKCNLKGNCLSILFGDDIENKSVSKYGFYNLFNGCTTIISVSEDFLTSTKIDTYSYANMFKDCTSLTDIPNLLFTSASGSYACTSMFENCKAITTIPNNILSKCKSLGWGSYGYMFSGCTSLKNAPDTLPATSLANSCYQYMFYNCSKLTNVPQLPATTLIANCYRYMFRNCTSLTTAPELPATKLANFCYAYMFDGCKLLNNITMLATDISATSCLNLWVRGVASTGTFVKHPDMSSLPTGTSGIPSGWTVVNNSQPGS